MTLFRSRRLEAIFSCQVNPDMPYSAIASLVTNRVAETTDLEYKSKAYGNSDKDKRDLCGDLTSLANASGGVLVLGVEEDEHAAAKAIRPVNVNDDEIRRVRSIAASGIAPLPQFDVFPVADPVDPNVGVIVIAVPQSPMRPHAVLVNDSLRFPRRHGAGTIYLTEAQVADEYRQRSRRLDEGAAALVRMEANVRSKMDGDTNAYLLVTLLPDSPGYFPLDTAAFRAFRGLVDRRSVGILDASFYWDRQRVAGGCLIANDARENGRPRYVACELHRDGSGVFVTTVGVDEARRTGEDVSSTSIDILDERLVDGVWSGLQFLASHARDRAGAAGNAAVRVSIAQADLPTRLYQVRRGMTSGLGYPLEGVAVAEGLCELDDLADPGPGLVAATYRLASELFQEYGKPECVQMTPEGALRLPYWSRHVYYERLVEWAKQNGIETTEEIVDGA